MMRTIVSKIGWFLLGFLGWFLCANILELGCLRLGGSEFFEIFLLIVVWLPTVGLVIALFAKERTWVPAGILAAVAANTALWLFFFWGALRYGLELLLLPWPIGPLALGQ